MTYSYSVIPWRDYLPGLVNTFISELSKDEAQKQAFDHAMSLLDSGYEYVTVTKNFDEPKDATG